MRLAAGVLVASVLVASPAAAGWKSKHVDSVVAAVDGKPILLSEVRLRAKPLLTTLRAAEPHPTPQHEEDVFRQLVDQMIREFVIAAEMEKAGVIVSYEETEAALEALARAVNMTPKDFLADVARAGWTELTYRAQIRRQILEGKFVRLRLGAGRTERELFDEVLAKHRVEKDLS